MEIIAFTFIWIWIAAATFVFSVRSGEATFIMRTKVTRAENAILYWLTVAFWFLAFIFFTYLVASLSLHAFQGAPPFKSRGLLPTSPKEWMLFGFDMLAFAALGYFVWSRVRLNRLMREIEAEEKGRA
jgi:hypothetical protein